MEDLFSTSLAIDSKRVNYRVVFDNDQYNFISDESNTAYKKFSLKREHDEWHEQQQLPSDLKAAAVQELEQYLLKQH